MRDVNSNAILNTNIEGLTMYKLQREQILKNSKLADEVQSLKSDIQDIKELLMRIATNVK